MRKTIMIHTTYEVDIPDLIDPDDFLDNLQNDLDDKADSLRFSDVELKLFDGPFVSFI